MISTTATDEQHEQYVRNIVSAWNLATPEQITEGSLWYRVAHRLAYQYSDGNVRAGAGVIAALSPQKAWGYNLKLAREAFEGPLTEAELKRLNELETKSATAQLSKEARAEMRELQNHRVKGNVRDACAKAERIILGEDPLDVLPQDSKTWNFYRCIVDPEDAEAVVIDRHAHDIAVGETFGSKDRGLSNKRRYATLAHAYREAARRIGQIPSVVQAVTWTVQVDATADLPYRAARNYGKESK